MSSAPSSSSTPRVRVYNRRAKMTSAQARDWASLPPTLLEKIFHCLEVSDLQSAKETCRKWKAQAVMGPGSANNQAGGAGGGGGGGGGGAPQAPAASWTDSIDSILQHLQHLHQEKEADVEVMMQFLVQEGIMKAP